MKRYILTGTPGAGKTSILRYLEKLGYFVVEEAATDVIALEQAGGTSEPWLNPDFINQILVLQQQREFYASRVVTEYQFFDRSPLDVYALSVFLKFPPSALLLQEIERLEKQAIFEKKVFFIENLGYCQPSESRKITFENALIFEKIHEETYQEHGYECIKIAPQSIAERGAKILQLLKEK